MSGHYQIYADCSTRVMHLNVEAEEDINWTELCWKTWTVDKLHTRWVDMKADAEVDASMSHRGKYSCRASV